MKYEFINMSDKITFCAENDDYARAVTLILGNGKAGCRTQEGKSLEHCMTVFQGEAPEYIYEQVKTMLKSKDEKLVSALKTVAVCGFEEREIYEDYTENYTNIDKILKWDDAHRTSLNQFCKYAQNLATNIERK